MTPISHAEPTIDQLMSPLPVTVQADADVAVAARAMEQHGIGHVVVAEGDTIVGVIDRTELTLLERLRGRWTLGAVVSRDPTYIARQARVHEVIAVLRTRGQSYALVGSALGVVGIVTTTDLLRALDEQLGGAAPSPSQVRRRILGEHDRIGTLLDELEAEARRVPNGTADDASRLRHRIRAAGSVLLSHLDLEERLLWPLLRDADSFGPKRVEEMEHEHVEQRSLLRSVLDELSVARSAEILSTGVLELVRAVRDDMVREEVLFREEGLLRDDVVAFDSFGG